MSSSRTIGERLASLETLATYQDKKIDKIVEDVERIATMQHSFIESASEKFARKEGCCRNEAVTWKQLIIFNSLLAGIIASIKTVVTFFMR